MLFNVKIEIPLTEVKTYANAKNAVKGINNALNKRKLDSNAITYIIIELDEYNCITPRYHGRYIPVIIGEQSYNVIKDTFLVYNFICIRG